MRAIAAAVSPQRTRLVASDGRHSSDCVLAPSAVTAPPAVGSWMLAGCQGLFGLLITAAVVLNYGFANIAVPSGAIPVPLADVLLAVLFAGTATLWRPGDIPGPITVAYLGYVGLALGRLFVDYPVYGTDAIRDFTTPLETARIFPAAVLARRSRTEWNATVWTVALGAVIVFAAFYPVREFIDNISPVVGIQRPVLLFNYSGIGPGVAVALLYFVLVVDRWWIGVVGASAALLSLVLLQQRGLYLAVPAAFGCVAAIGVSDMRRRLATRVCMGTAAAALSLTLLLSMQISLPARLGEFDFEFLAAHAGTLVGGDGPSSGSLTDRVKWINYGLQDVARTDRTILFGLGLGEDLAGGFQADQEHAVRKPHNDFLETFLRFGLVGFAFWLSLLLLSLGYTFRAITRAASVREQRVVVWSFAAALLYLMAAATQPYLAYPSGTFPLFGILGIGIGISRRRPSAIPIARRTAV